MISVLCVMPGSNYFQIPGLDLWDAKRDAYNFIGSNPVITHAPCAQWSRLKAFANDNPREKELAWFCLEKVRRNGGIFEHPAGSSFFKEAGIKKIYSVDQSWWGFPARKRTYLYFHGYKPLAFPLSFDRITYKVGGNRNGSLISMIKRDHSKMTLSFCQYLVDCLSV